VAATLEEAKAQFKRRYPEVKGRTDGVANPDFGETGFHYPARRRAAIFATGAYRSPHTGTRIAMRSGVFNRQGLSSPAAREKAECANAETLAVVTPGLDRSLIERPLSRTEYSTP
jgi:hypothetical protein